MKPGTPARCSNLGEVAEEVLRLGTHVEDLLVVLADQGALRSRKVDVEGATRTAFWIGGSPPLPEAWQFKPGEVVWRRGGWWLLHDNNLHPLEKGWEKYVVCVTGGTDPLYRLLDAEA